MTVLETLNSIIECLKEAEADAAKVDKGNASAGVRLRKTAQVAVRSLKEMRLQVQEIKRHGKSNKS